MLDLQLSQIQNITTPEPHGLILWQRTEHPLLLQANTLID
jgi:hypothetical protein